AGAGWAAARIGAASAAAEAAGASAQVSASDALPIGVGRAMIERLPLGLMLLDGAGRVMFENTAAEDVLERRTLGMPGAAALRAPALSEAIARALGESRGAELDVTLQRSKERMLHAHVHPLPRATGAAGEPAVMILLEDRTRIVKAEALRRDFIANASHELKTPLASIAGFIETLQGHARGDAEATDRFLAIMSAQAERMKRLVEDLLSLNRIEINEHVLPRGPADVAEAAREAIAAMRPVAEAEGGAVLDDLPPGPVVIRGSHEELVQVFVNLIENAVKYAGPSGPIRVCREPPAATRPGMVGVSVVDQGPGIAREHLPRLTERFYRVDVARSRERGGTGLGLAIAKHILNRHRGDLTVTSVLGQGARFTVWLPGPPDQPAAAAPSRTAETAGA
ncbi:MAG: hypothetical protein EA355_00350, partial [Rhodobacteraceae bacterium]